MKKKLLAAVLAGLLAFGPVLTAGAETLPVSEEPVSEEPVNGEDKTTQYDGDKTKYQALIDAMIEASKLDAFGKPAYKWTLPELTDFVNKEFPNMTKYESEYDAIWKVGKEPGKEKTVTYQGSEGDSYGSVSRSDFTFPDGSWHSVDTAIYSVHNGSTDSRINAWDIAYSTGSISSDVQYNNDKALAKLSTLDGALAMIDDSDVVNYMNTEREIDNKRIYNFLDKTSLTFIPNTNKTSTDESHLDTVDATIIFTFRNHRIDLFYIDGVSDFVIYRTTFTPTDMYRLYNPNSGEHFYTANRKEADGLVAVGWHDEGLGWKAPLMSDTPVYRLYNPNSGDHHYTPDEKEKDNLIAAGWNDEGVGWYSFERKTTKLFRLYNPNEKTGTHHYTTDEGERDSLVKQGWVDEGIGWYGM